VGYVVDVGNVSQPIRDELDGITWIEALVELIPGGVAIVGADGSVLFANERAQTLLPWGPRLDAAVARVRSGERISDEGFDVDVGGAERRVDVNGTPIHAADGSFVAAAFLVRDVTARERRAQAERDFVTNAAHELQTPIAAITSAIEVLQRGAKERSGERDRFLAHIAHATERLTRLTEALLVLARAQAGDEKPRHEIVTLAPLLESIARLLSPEGAVEVSCAQDLAAITNRPLLEQAIVNLGQNALKHAPGRVVLSAHQHDGTVRIDVRDHGPGIDPEETALVFDRFYRRDEAGGFGLGLAIVREAVEAIGGELELDSGPDGTRVSISLPRARVRQR
jgi:two-component system, OmpR family, phosphate regulon sensor histidine kinase PhoR